MIWWQILLIVAVSLFIGLPFLSFLIFWIVLGVISIVAICKD